MKKVVELNRLCPWYRNINEKSGGVKLDLWTQTSPLSDMMQSCNFSMNLI
jgi:hypothetical protein